jgi:hypothetical protein
MTQYIVTVLLSASYDVFKFRWAILDRIRRTTGLGVGLDEAVEIRKILIFRYVGIFRDIIWLINSLLRVRPGPFAGRPARFFPFRKPGPPAGPCRPLPYRLHVHMQLMGREARDAIIIKL